MEPDILRRGKLFHCRVQDAWSGSVEGSTVRVEHGILIPALATARHNRRGRIDVFVDLIGDFVTVVEIKSTDWDVVVGYNLPRLLASHRRQVMRYVEKYLDQDRVSVCGGVIYPTAPRQPGLKDRVEKYLNDHGLQVVWFDDE
jgi:hypothetical protein